MHFLGLFISVSLFSKPCTIPESFSISRWGQRVRDGEDNQIARLGAPTWQDGVFLQQEAHDHRSGEHQNRNDTTESGPLPAPLVCHDDPLRGIPLKGQSLLRL